MYNCSVSEEYSRLKSTCDPSIKRKKLDKEVAYTLANDFQLFGLYLDVVNAGKQGVPKESILTQIGQEKLYMVDYLLKHSLIEEDKVKYYTTEKFVIFDQLNTFNFSQTVIQHQKDKFLQGQYKKGKLRFYIDDVDSKAYDEINKLYEDFMEKAVNVMKKNNKTKDKDGKRVYLQSLLTHFCLILALCFSITNTAFTSGAGGDVTGTDELNEYVNNPRLNVDLPVVNFSGRYIHINHVCHADDIDKLRTAKKYKICVKNFSYGGDGPDRCTKRVKKFLFTKRKFEVTKCDNNACTSTITVPFEYPLQHTINVFKQPFGGRGSRTGRKVKELEYQIDNCYDL